MWDVDDVHRLNLPRGGDRQITPDREAVVLEMLGFLQLVPPDESPESTVVVTEGMLGTEGVVWHWLLLSIVKQAEGEPCSDAMAMGDIDIVVVEVELEEDGYEVGASGVAAVGVIADVPAVAADAERSGLDVAAGRDILGAGVAVDLQQVLPALGAGGDDG